MKYYSPLRYPGGKGKLAKFLKDILCYNNLKNGIYIEPYAGGAAIALALLIEGYTSEVIINDIDPAIYYLWYSIINNTEDFIQQIIDTPINMEVWYKQKKIYNNMESYSPREIGFATFFLNRTCRSGILNAGVIGGNKQSGNYKIDARYNKSNLVKRIELIARHKNKIKVYNLDALTLLKKVIKDYRGKDYLIYLDPPYYNKGKELYRNFYSPEDHIMISKTFKSLTQPTIITYDSVEAIQKIYQGEQSIELSLLYTINNARRTIATELMFYRNLKLPYHPNIPI